jgi:hypothetical protein
VEEITFPDVVQALAELADQNQALAARVAELQAPQPAGSAQLTSGADDGVALTAVGDRGMALTAHGASEVKRLRRLQRSVC